MVRAGTGHRMAHDGRGRRLPGTMACRASPAHAAGTVDVKVTNVKGTSAVVAADKYTYS